MHGADRNLFGRRRLNTGVCDPNGALLSFQGMEGQSGPPGNMGSPGEQVIEQVSTSSSYCRCYAPELN